MAGTLDDGYEPGRSGTAVTVDYYENVGDLLGTSNPNYGGRHPILRRQWQKTTVITTPNHAVDDVSEDFLYVLVACMQLAPQPLEMPSKSLHICHYPDTAAPLEHSLVLIQTEPLVTPPPEPEFAPIPAAPFCGAPLGSEYD